MTATVRPRRSRAAAWGWGIVTVTCLLLLVNAAVLYVAVTMPSTLEADTGVPVGVLDASFPSVVEELNARGRSIAVLLGGLAALGLAVAITGARGAPDSARSSLWVLVAALALVAVNALVGGRAAIGGFYLMWAAIVAVGLFLTTRADR